MSVVRVIARRHMKESLDDHHHRPRRRVRPRRLQGGRPFPRRLRSQGDRARRVRDARSDGAARAPRGVATTRRSPNYRFAPHDDPDRSVDRDAGRARCAGALGVVQHLLHAGPRGRGDRRGGHPGFRLEGRDPRGVLVVHRARAVVAGRPGRAADRSQHDPRRRWRRHAGRAQGSRVRARGRSARPVDR